MRIAPKLRPNLTFSWNCSLPCCAPSRLRTPKALVFFSLFFPVSPRRVAQPGTQTLFAAPLLHVRRCDLIGGTGGGPFLKSNDLSIRVSQSRPHLFSNPSNDVLEKWSASFLSFHKFPPPGDFERLQLRPLTPYFSPSRVPCPTAPPLI